MQFYILLFFRRAPLLPFGALQISIAAIAPPNVSRAAIQNVLISPSKTSKYSGWAGNQLGGADIADNGAVSAAGSADFERQSRAGDISIQCTCYPHRNLAFKQTFVFTILYFFTIYSVLLL